MDKESLLKKWLRDELTAEETKQFQDLEQADRYEEVLQEAKRFSAHKQAKVASFDNLYQGIETPKQTHYTWIKIAASMAAIFVIAFSVYQFITQDQIRNFETELGQQEEIILPDKSIVHLNESSQLEYNQTQWNDERKLSLNGEAFFEVEKGAQFIVHTESGDVQVLGTKFNVISQDSLFQVACYHGLVRVKHKNQEILLPAGSQFSFKEGRATKTDLLRSKPIWVNNMSVFDKVPLDKVLKAIEETYQVEIILEYEGNEIFTGAFEHNDLEQALQSVTQPFNLSYKILNDQQVVIHHVED